MSYHPRRTTYLGDQQKVPMIPIINLESFHNKFRKSVIVLALHHSCCVPRIVCPNPVTQQHQLFNNSTPTPTPQLSWTAKYYNTKQTTSYDYSSYHLYWSTSSVAYDFYSDNQATKLVLNKQFSSTFVSSLHQHPVLVVRYYWCQNVNCTSPFHRILCSI